MSSASAPAGPSGRRAEPYANAYPQSYEMRPAQKVWQYEGALELVALAPGVPLLLGYVCRAPTAATASTASQTAISVHAPPEAQRRVLDT